MTETTPRDRAWMVAIEALRTGDDIRIKDVVNRADVSRQTAQGVMHVALEAGFFARESDQAHWFHPIVGPLSEVDDWEYQRAIETLIREAKED